MLQYIQYNFKYFEGLFLCLVYCHWISQSNWKFSYANKSGVLVTDLGLFWGTKHRYLEQRCVILNALSRGRLKFRTVEP